MNNEPPNDPSGKKGTQLQLAQHTLRISDPQRSLSFYQNALGMRLLAQHEAHDGGKQETHYFLGFTDRCDVYALNYHELLTTPCTLLELVHQPQHPLPLDAAINSENNARYWKIGITLADVDIARERLLAAGVEVSEPKQFLDVGYLCHLNDPDGYCIELLQHDFAQNHKAVAVDPAYKLGGAPTLGQITLRISDPESSLRFYQDLVGMRLLSRQVIKAYQFTLYFLACTNETPPHPDIDAVENREWLWQRPYTTLELQHVWDTEWRGLVRPTGADAGFMRISFATKALQSLVAQLANQESEIAQPSAFDDVLNTSTATVRDPNDNAVRFIEAG